MYTLTDWSFFSEQHKCLAWGIVSGHHRLPDGIFIHTSSVRRVSVDEENTGLLVHTKSGSQYRLLFADIALDRIENTRPCLQKFGISTDFLHRYEKIYADSEKEKLFKLDGALNPNELLLEMHGVSARRAYFKDETGGLHEIQIMTHLGMSQDSILVTDWTNGLVDFRYFPNDCIKPYHWSDGLKAVKIENRGGINIYFGGNHRKILCKPCEITVIERGEYSGSGECLFHSDASDQ